MLASFLTTFFFSLSVLFAARSARALGGPTANLGRVLVALVFLAAWAHLFGAGWKGPAFGWFFLSGIIGFGLGDMALFGALPRIGPRLAILLTQCLAAPLAAIAEWLWLGTKLAPRDVLCAAIILAGVALALSPDHGVPIARRTFWIGVLFGIGSACGQGFGAVLSRKANLLTSAAHFPVDGGSAAYQRLLGGACMTLFAFLIFRSWRVDPSLDLRSRLSRAWPWMVGNGLAGPAIGVGCFQWALSTTPTGIVLPIVATAPVITIVLAYFGERQKPTARALAGALIAVFGAALLASGR